MKNELPIIAITMGDPSGIGPEIAVKSLSMQNTYNICRPLITGDAKVIEDAINNIVKVDLIVRSISRVKDAKFEYGIIDVIDLKNIDIDLLEYGKVQAISGKAAFEAVEKAIYLAMAGEVQATVTGPLNKEALNLAGYHYSGHTEIYAKYTNTKNYSMMLIDGNLRVVHVSTHVSLRQACDNVKKDRIFNVIKLAHDTMVQFGIEKPRIGVAGLNPHAGEGGLFGWEEEKEIKPAIEEAIKFGINVDGPVPPDTIFSKAIGGQYDIVVAMYHDQGHIPIKVVGFNWNEDFNKWESVSGVNITLGLPIIRTSVDHGTAFGKAGKGFASADSLLNAISFAVGLSTKDLLERDKSDI